MSEAKKVAAEICKLDTTAERKKAIDALPKSERWIVKTYVDQEMTRRSRSNLTKHNGWKEQNATCVGG